MAWLREGMRRRPLAWFYALAVGIAVAVIPLFVLTGADAKIAAAREKTGIEFGTDFVTISRIALEAPESTAAILLAVLQPFSPDIAAFIVTTVALGTVGLRNLVGRYRFWHSSVGWRSGLKVWGVCILTFVGMSVATAVLHRLFMPEGTWKWGMDVFSWGLPLALFVSVWLDVGGVSEETGWRGFALPILQNRMTPLVASVVLGVLWAVWHFPVKFDVLFYGPGGAVVLYGLLVVRFVFLSIVMTYFYNRVGGSTLIAIAMHGLHNDSAGLMGRITGDGLAPYVISEIDLLLPIVAVACVLMFLSGRKLGFDRVSASEQ